MIIGQVGRHWTVVTDSTTRTSVMSTLLSTIATLIIFHVSLPLAQGAESCGTICRTGQPCAAAPAPCPGSQLQEQRVGAGRRLGARHHLRSRLRLRGHSQGPLCSPRAIGVYLDSAHPCPSVVVEIIRAPRAIPGQTAPAETVRPPGNAPNP